MFDMKPGKKGWQAAILRLVRPTLSRAAFPTPDGGDFLFIATAKHYQYPRTNRMYLVAASSQGFRDVKSENETETDDQQNNLNMLAASISNNPIVAFSSQILRGLISSGPSTKPVADVLYNTCMYNPYDDNAKQDGSTNEPLQETNTH